MVQTKVLRLMTWNRKHPTLFPFGSSIFPLIITTLIIEIPTAAITYAIITRSFYPYPLVPALMLVNLFTIFMLYRCVYTDPGIIGQIVDKYEWEQNHAMIPAKNHMNLSEHKYTMVTNGINTYQKYCIECCIYRPLRTIHCQACNHCVERYDHHCPWLGICIAKFNYKYFFMFIVGVVVLSASVTAVSLAIIASLASAFPIKSYILQMVVAVTSGFLFFPVFKLLTYHIKLFYNRQTTNQDLKKVYHVIQSDPPFERCDFNHRGVKVNLKGKLTLSATIKGRESSEQEKSTKQSGNKGTRYSTLVSERQSVLNSLVQTQL